jgi:hypothetical protein
VAIKTIRTKIDTAPLLALEAEFSKLEDFIKQKNRAYARICRRLEPMIQKMLVASLAKSNLHLGGGKGRRMALSKIVGGAIVFPTSKGIRIGLPRNLDPDLYAKAGALQYGAIHGTGLKTRKTIQKLKANAAEQHKRYGVTKGPSGGFVQAHPYFGLDSGQIAQIEAAFIAALQAEVDRISQEQGA